MESDLFKGSPETPGWFFPVLTSVSLSCIIFRVELVGQGQSATGPHDINFAEHSYFVVRVLPFKCLTFDSELETAAW